MTIFRNNNYPYSINSFPTSKSPVQNLVTKFTDLFSQMLGLLKSVKVYTYHIKEESASLKFFKAHPIPYASRDKVN